LKTEFRSTPCDKADDSNQEGFPEAAGRRAVCGRWLRRMSIAAGVWKAHNRAKERSHRAIAEMPDRGIRTFCVAVRRLTE
jgi:hypothetical protein